MADPAPIPLAEQIAAVRTRVRVMALEREQVRRHGSEDALAEYDRTLAAMRAVLTTLEGIDHAG